MNKVDLVERPRLRRDLPAFRPGDTVKVHVKVAEGGRERIQLFQGVVIRKRGGGLRESFTVRKISFNGVGVERTFPLHSPTVAGIDIVQHGRVRRAKLYYLRERTGRHAKIRERRVDQAAEAALAPAGPGPEEPEATAEPGAVADAQPVLDGDGEGEDAVEGAEPVEQEV